LRNTDLEGHSEELIKRLEEIARDLRMDVIKALGKTGSGYLAESLSAAEIIASLYFHHLRLNPSDPLWDGRDRFVLSKLRAAPILYAALSRAGFFPAERLQSLKPSEEGINRLPGVDADLTSPGRGLSVGLEIALQAKLSKKGFWVYVLLGEEEIQDERVQEAALDALHAKADNLTVIVDYNGVPVGSEDFDVMGPEPMVQKWESFGWFVIEIDGHDIFQMLYTLDEAVRVKGKPTVVVAHTVKGKV
jgi:transketolase